MNVSKVLRFLTIQATDVTIYKPSLSRSDRRGKCGRDTFATQNPVENVIVQPGTSDNCYYN